MSQTPKKFRKKPVIIEGFQFTKENGADVIDWIRSNGNAANWNHLSHDEQSIDIVTLEGVMTANLNDIIIKGVQGEMYPCKPDIFSSTYEAV